MLIIEINFQAEPCNCNTLGSSSITCDDNTGQCNCNDNVVGIRPQDVIVFYERHDEENDDVLVEVST